MYTKLLSISIILFGLLFTFSCNKFKPDTLDGELCFNWCTGLGTIEETIYPEENNFSLVFEEEGFISFFVGDSLLRKEGITIDTLVEHSNNSKQVFIHLNGDMNDLFFGRGTTSLSFFSEFPFRENDPGCENYTNYFSKR